MYQSQYLSPIGEIYLEADEEGLRRLDFIPRDCAGNDKAHFRDLIEQLDAYFAGQLKNFEVAIKLEGTEFQKEVWSSLQKIPHGETWSYSQLATDVGRPKAVRAVGSTNARNPISIVVPCHRVIGKSGALTGYAGGLDRKAFLLELEAGQTAPLVL